MFLLLGCGMIVLCMGIQVIVVSVLLHLLRTLEDRHLIQFTIISAWTLLTGVLLILFTGNLIQVTLWAWMFSAFGEFKDFSTAFYHSLVNFTTLGYGDLVLTVERRLLGALEAANGALMLGLTTSVLYSTIRALMRQSRRKGKDNKPSPANTDSRQAIAS